jgi:uncharacterized membrane protein YccC
VVRPRSRAAVAASALDKAEIVRSLRTRDLRGANRKKHQAVADILEMLANAKAEASFPKG